ncbi:monofunctional biosynthetic peptidoglycan transglycosylase [Fontimonas sp. SYSU GA230001]|uniref:monofunctional biosynthetic peptidoglycan transglycosylase n=1 Tax=Fontimonas sp. SYSU GA230001 TaxID=3142450 RepID=UPI0032B409B3
MSVPELHAPPRRRARARRRPALLAWLLRGAGGALALVVTTVLVLRWLPPPTTAFMLQSPVRPVHHTWVPAERISRHLQRAVVASEDQKFYVHRGFDLDAIEEAAQRNRRGARRRGASTISQQTAKNLFLWPGGGYFRKGLEAGLTVLIEALWPKARILEMYLNIAEFGPGIYGAEAAAQRLFGKPAARLSAEEAARLAAVLPSPRRWNARDPGPYVRERSAWILRQMGYRDDTAAVPEPAADPASADGDGGSADSSDNASYPTPSGT